MPFTGNNFDRKLRYALLAGTALATAVLAQPSVAQNEIRSAQQSLLLAQAPSVDPQTGRPLPKGAQPKGAPPKSTQSPPPGAQPKQVGQPPQGAPPKQMGQPPQGGQPKQIGQPPLGAPPQQMGQPPQGVPPPQGARPKQIGQPPQGGQPKQVGQPPQVPPPGAQPTQVGQPPQAPPPGGQPAQVGQPPQAAPPLPGQPAQTGQPSQGAPVPGVQPRQTGQPHRAGQPKQVGQPPQQPATLPGATPGGPPQQQTGRPPQLPGQPVPTPGGPTPTPSSAAPGQPVAPAAPQQAGRPPGAAPQPGWGGHVDQLRSQRRERSEGGRVVIEEPGRRIIVRDGNTTIIRNDDNERFRRWGAPRFEQRGHEHYAYIARPGGYQIINVTDADGRLLRRVRRGPDGREIVLIDNRRGPGFGAGVAVGAGVGLATGVLLGLAAPVVTIPRERYIVDVSAAPQPLLYETLEAPPVVAIERPYSLDEIRYNVALRDRMRRIDIDSITFESGSWEVTPEQYPRLEAIADAMRRVLERNPDEVFMLEGHTDAVGSDVDNLSLSDRRAESVAVILTDAYQIPPENLVSQGYGEQHPKIPIAGPSRENRRVAMRRITPLLNGAVASR